MNTPFLDTARRVIRCESEALTLLADSLDDRFRAAVDLMRACKGRVIVTGIGKSWTKVCLFFSWTDAC